jgi:hypothetical protein
VCFDAAGLNVPEPAIRAMPSGFMLGVGRVMIAG